MAQLDRLFGGSFAAVIGINETVHSALVLHFCPCVNALLSKQVIVLFVYRKPFKSIEPLARVLLAQRAHLNSFFFCADSDSTARVSAPVLA